jgi:pimeloyl-ACP methyl ester carboxylesterase
MTRTIVFIHGNFVTRHCWDAWVTRYEKLGYTCIPIAYPGREGSPASLRNNADSALMASLTLARVVEHHVTAIRALNEKPIVIGHSFGGLLTQLMVQRDLPAAAVAIDSVPPQGVLTLKWSFYRSTFPALNPFLPASNPYMMSFKHFQYAFANDLSLAEQRVAYEKDMVPESRRLSRGGLSSAARVDFKRRRSPLLLIAGEKDRIMPAALNRTNFRRYRKSPSVTEFKEFPGRSHYSIIAGKGWEEVADYALDWAMRAASSREGRPRQESNFDSRRLGRDEGVAVEAGG